MKLKAWCAVLFFGILGTQVLLKAQITDATSTTPRGRLLVEMDALYHECDRYTPARDGIHTKSTCYGSTLLSTGLADRLDVQFGIDPHTRVRWSGAEEGHASGLADSYARLKWNFHGTEGESLSLALLPWVTFPTGDSDIGAARAQYGVLLPVSLPLSEGWLFSAQLGLSALDDGEGGRDGAVGGTLCLTRTLNDKFSAFGEWVGDATLESGGSRTHLLGVGLCLSINERLQVAVSHYIGLNREAVDSRSLLSVYVTF